MPGVLDGVRVLELGQVLAGPFAGAIFADLGAEVVKVERVDGGDDARRMGPAFRHGDALNFQVFNRGKQSVALDLKSGDGLAAFERLAAEADIFIHNLRPGVPKALGIDGPSLCARHPRLIYCEISAFGSAGPMALRPGYEPLIQAFSGLSSTNGGPDDPPLRAGASVCDQGTGMWAVIGALAMLHRRQGTGRGGILSASLLETALVWNGQKADAYVNEGRLPDRHRSGHPGFVPYEAFDTADAPLLICCGNDRLFTKLAAELGRPDWPADERFATNRARLAHKAALLAELEPLLRQRPRAEWTARLEAAGVPCAPIHTVPEALAHPQVQALGVLQAVPGEDFRLTALPFTIDGERPALHAGAPRLGQHNALHGIPDHHHQATQKETP
ncbi:CoA transferase [Ottowia sp.]|uniref:CaiB/BaiF CoA transferase family protein n=1 Tax=Ottowia sp. TaxID=1898956 RepID=UPI001D94272F|nr:CoA transferase [Ottowia sp.]MCB2025430.1 CoA transferase [Ottowia sp.]MCB2033717.1 CoA transferase [Ottowia sp.]MCP5256481.1 CoA transferase [Burkholderiaceae bacterium]HRW72244.1 CoA transferase [Ottowia sp.]